jgi:mono/diheme cytochrome c family protein
VTRNPGVTAALAAAALALAPLANADPRIDYVLHCQGCHLPDGRGQPGAVPSLRAELGRFLSVPGGREYLVQVPGTAQAELSDARIAALLGWMLVEFSPAAVPADFSPYSADEVARLRRRPLLSADQTRRELLRAIESLEPPAE